MCFLWLSVAGCAAELPTVVEKSDVTGPIVVGRAVTVLTDGTTRRYEPKVRFFELENQQTGQRFMVDIDAQDTHFALSLTPGEYRLNRVQISEGPFMSMADFSSTFPVGNDPITYVGIWRFGVGIPRYGRRIAVSIVMDQGARSEARQFLEDQYPDYEEQPLAEVLPEPSQVETRLYEVMPYPRYPRYFRRHWW